MTTTPTPGFEFPPGLRDRADQLLRQQAEGGQPPLKSVRPERQGTPQKVIVPELESATAVAPVTTASPAAPQNTVPFTPASPTPIPTAEYVSIDLPSGFAYYPFKDLYVKPFRIPHLAKLARADATNSLQLVAETVGSVLMAPGHDNPVMLLSLADLNAVMLWLRLNSFTQKTITVTTECTNPAHIKRVADKQLPESTLQVHTRVDQTSIEIKNLTHIPDPERYTLTFQEPDGSTSRLRLRPETVKDSIEFLDHPEWTEPDFQYKAKLASVLDLESLVPDRKWTLTDKIAFLEAELSTDQAVLVSEFCDLIDQHGVVESVATKCPECGASGSALLTFDARSFLSPRF